MAKAKSIKQIIVYCMLLCMGLLATIGIGTDAIGCLSDPANKYAGMYFFYHELGEMWIMVETDTGVDSDRDHAVLYISGSGCADPDLEYHHYDYDYWDDGSGIPGKKDRRLWAIKATGLTPDCFYDAEFKYRDYHGDYCWHATHGHFHSAPQTSSTNPDYIPHDLEFYAFGDTRTIDSNDYLSDVAEAIMSHDGKNTFILHTGDFVYQGGRPVGKYWFRNGYDDKGKENPWVIHNNDWWYDNFFNVGKVWEMLRHMPIIPVFGNHEFMDSAVGCKYAPYDKESHFLYNCDDKYLTYNYAHYFRNSGHGPRPSDMYYSFSYGSAKIWSLTSFYMDSDVYCSDTNANYRPKAEGGTGQYDWLEEQLKAAANDPRQWKIVMMHAPMFSPCDCNNQEDARTYLKPLFEKYGVDLFLSGHEHYYARKTVNDIPYLILGGGGAGLDICKACETDSQCNDFDYVAKKHHFAYFEINGDTMTVHVLDENNKEFDSFTVDRTPGADFEADPAKGPPPLTVNFTNKSAGNIYKYDWDFGDESDHSQEENPTHEYTKEGDYKVKLTVSSAFNTSTYSVRVTCEKDSYPMHR